MFSTKNIEFYYWRQMVFISLKLLAYIRFLLLSFLLLSYFPTYGDRFTIQIRQAANVKLDECNKKKEWNLKGINQLDTVAMNRQP